MTGEYRDPASRESAGPAPGSRYGTWVELSGTAHHLLLSGTEDDSLPDFRDRWAGVVEVARVDGDDSPAERAGPGLILVRPDAYVASVAARADAPGIAAADAHLGSYLIPA